MTWRRWLTEPGPDYHSVIPLPLIKNQLRIDLDDTTQDSNLTVWAAGLLADAEAYTHAFFAPQSWCLQGVLADGWPLRLPHPVLAVLSVSVIGADGGARDLTAVDYRLERDRHATGLHPVGTWPVLASRPDAITITVRAGYDVLPMAVQRWLLASMQTLYESDGKDQNLIAKHALDPYWIPPHDT